MPIKYLEKSLVCGKSMLNCEPIVLLILVRRNQRVTKAGMAVLRAVHSKAFIKHLLYTTFTYTPEETF